MLSFVNMECSVSNYVVSYFSVLYFVTCSTEYAMQQATFVQCDSDHRRNTAINQLNRLCDLSEFFLIELSFFIFDVRYL